MNDLMHENDREGGSSDHTVEWRQAQGLQFEPFRGRLHPLFHSRCLCPISTKIKYGNIFHYCLWVIVPTGVYC